MLKKIFTTLVVVVGTSLLLNAQMSFNVGYALGFTNPKIQNGIIRQFNEINHWLEDDLNNLRVLHGIHFGLHYHFENFGVAVSWTNKFRDIRASGLDPVREINFERKLYFRDHSFSIALENHFGLLGYGATLDANRFMTKLETEDIDTRTVIDQWGWSSHFYLSLNIRNGRNMQVSLRPYVQIPWTSVDLQPLEYELKTGYSAESFKEKFMNFGVMIIFQNGPGR